MARKELPLPAQEVSSTPPRSITAAVDLRGVAKEKAGDRLDMGLLWQCLCHRHFSYNKQHCFQAVGLAASMPGRAGPAPQAAADDVCCEPHREHAENEACHLACKWQRRYGGCWQDVELSSQWEWRLPFHTAVTEIHPPATEMLQIQPDLPPHR